MKIKQFSDVFSAWLCRKIGIKTDDVPIYAYGFELLFSAVINVFFMILIAFLFHDKYASLMFLLAFIPLRITAGGYHAKTHLRCTLICQIVFTGGMLLAESIPSSYYRALSIGACFVNLGTAICFSPVEAFAKPLNCRERSKNRKYALIISILLFGRSLSRFVYPTKYCNWAFYYGVFTAAISQVAGKIQTYTERRRANAENSCNSY